MNKKDEQLFVEAIERLNARPKPRKGYVTGVICRQCGELIKDSLLKHIEAFHREGISK